MTRRSMIFLAALALGVAAGAQAEDPGKLPNDQLIALDRSADDAKSKPVYEALLTRKGIDKKYRDEAADALAKIDRSDPAAEILQAFTSVEAGDSVTLRELAGMLTAQKPESLKALWEKLVAAAQTSPTPLVREAAFAAIAVADAKPDEAWQLATKSDGGIVAMLGGVPLIPDAALREAFYPLAAPLAAQAPDQATQVAAITALGFIPGHEAQTFKTFTDAIRSGDPALRDAAVRSAGRMPSSKWPADQVETLAQAVVKLIESTPTDQRTTLAGTEAEQLANDLAAALSPEKGNPIRKSLRALVGSVALVHTVRDQGRYDLNYFVVEAGKPVRIVLVNGDGMAHNMLVCAPKSIQMIGMMAGGMAPPEDPKEKAYVPNSPKVLQALPLIQPGESGTLGFDAPTKPGDYAYLCTVPGHFQTMHGVMLVVPDIEQYEQAQTPPNDPLTRRPYRQQKAE